jgi:hypothetical protein
VNGMRALVSATRMVGSDIVVVEAR